MKKNLLFLCLIILTSFSLSAQFGVVNQKVIGGTINLGFNKADGTMAPNYYQQSNASLGFSYGKFTKKNTLSIFSLSYNISSSKNDVGLNTITNKSNGFTVGYRKIYYKEIAPKLYAGIGVGGNIGYTNSTQKQSIFAGKNETSIYSASVDLAPSLSYQISSRFMVNLNANNFASLNYIHSKNRDQLGNTGKMNGVGFNAGFFSNPFNNMSFGFSYLLKN
ncbi:MAG: hypothetical protein EAZ13_00710 [Sphingobacteriia bacterium]|nr:MAG: hypothetical protein EAZ35_00965 [Sphingobacteriia bacterium]TAH09302.1 MAG: hypothetical protein EAZ13_00710 [Sphingobacteriia bacterium]